jgi:hypothetical protein
VGGRAFETGGNALLIGAAGETSNVIGVYLKHFEALGCAWDSGVREYVEQIAIQAQQWTADHFDIEDQQYANSTTSSTGMARTALANPSKGLRILSDGCVVNQPYFSSLVQSIEIGANVDDVQIFNPRIFDGAYATPQADAIVAPASVTALFFKGRTQAGATNLIKSQSSNGEIWIDGVRYIPTTGSTFNVKAPEIAEEFTIASGTLTAACNNIVVRGEGNLADELAGFRYVVGVNGFTGHQITLLYGGETITIKNGTSNIITSTGADLSLSATYPVRRLTYDGTNWFAE